MRTLLLILALLWPTAAFAQPVTLKLQPVANGLSFPVFATAPAGDPRLFVVEKTGTIRILADGKISDAPFLDISSKVSGDSEQGLLGLAFHPDYATNGLFFIDYTDATGATHVDSCAVGRFADAASAGSCKTLLTVPQPYPNHNGGWIGFGPDGLLYIALGDGGDAGDPQGNGQNTEVLLGKILRIDVDGALPYAIPPNNPFAKGGGAPEIFVLGMRNPWRDAFDGDNLYLADVGQDRVEEVTVVTPTDGGANLGWRVIEGDRCFRAKTCASEGMTPPAYTYMHKSNNCSITGGYVYRGTAIPEIAGQYFFADFCSGMVASFAYADGKAGPVTDWTNQLTQVSISSFAVDSSGELYLMTIDGSLFKIVRG